MAASISTPSVWVAVFFLLPAISLQACGSGRDETAAASPAQVFRLGAESGTVRLPVVVPNNGRAVRTARAETTAVQWVDLFGTPSLIQSLQVLGLATGDVVFVRAGVGYTNDLATSAIQKGSVRYKNENRYTVNIEGSIKQSSRPGISGAVISKDAVNTDFVQHHGFTSLRGAGQISDPTNNIFNFVLRGNVVGGPTPKLAVRRNNQKATPPAPGGVPSVFMEPGSARTKLDVLIFSRGWESSFIKSNLRSSRGHVRATRVNRNARVIGISVPLGLVKAGEIFDAATEITCTAVSDSPQLCTHQVLLTDSELSDFGEELTIRFGKNVPPRGTSTFQFYGALTAQRNYPTGAYLNVLVKTNSDTSGSGFLRLEKNSFVEFSRYTPRF